MSSVTKCWVVVCFAATLCVAQSHHTGHHFIPVPFPYSAGSYRHTSSVVNVPVHQERLIIVQKPGNQHHPRHSEAHNHNHAHGHNYHHPHTSNHGSINHGSTDQEPRMPPPASTVIRHFLSFYQAPQSSRYPYFQDVGFLLDPRLAQQSAWLDQFQDML